jgi:HPt (histidine-containing phosphotransfer) domain-containing protein
MIDVNKNNSPLDLSYLRDMSGDSPEFIIEMIDMFKQQTPIYMAELEQALQAEDWPNVASGSHKIKPTFSYVGRDDAKEHMQKMEHRARDLKELSQLPSDFKEISDFVKILYRQLDEAKAMLEKQL